MGVMKQWERKSGVRFTAHVDLGGSATLFRKDGAKLGSYLVQDLTSRGALLTGDGGVNRDPSRCRRLYVDRMHFVGCRFGSSYCRCNSCCSIDHNTSCFCVPAV